MFTITSGPHFQIINWNFDFSSWGGLRIESWVWGHFGRALSGIHFEFKSPPVNAACALLLLFVMAEAVAEAEAEAVAEARGFTLARLELISIFTLKTTINN